MFNFKTKFEFFSYEGTMAFSMYTKIFYINTNKLFLRIYLNNILNHNKKSDLSLI